MLVAEQMADFVIMRDIISKLVHCLSWLAAVLTVVASAFWVGIIADGNYCWSAFAFTMTCIPLGGGTLLLGVIPSSALYLKRRRRGDLISLLLTGCALAILLVEVILLEIIPQRGE